MANLVGINTGPRDESLEGDTVHACCVELSHYWRFTDMGVEYIGRIQGQAGRCGVLMRRKVDYSWDGRCLSINSRTDVIGWFKVYVLWSRCSGRNNQEGSE